MAVLDSLMSSSKVNDSLNRISIRMVAAIKTVQKTNTFFHNWIRACLD